MPFEFDLTSKGWAAFGLRGSGKSWLLKSIADTTPSHIVYDPLREHEGYNRYIPDDRTSVPELNRFISEIVIPRRPALVVIDEASRYIKPKPNPLPEAVGDLNDFARHWKISCGYVARRPVQFHTDIVELADVVFFFALPGKNDHRYLEDLHVGLGDAVRELPKYHFAVLSENGRKWDVLPPIGEPKHPVKT